MKRVNFGHKGGFPLEQETLIHLQRAFADDMLGALLAQWGIDPTKNYIIKDATSDDDDGWVVTTITREEIDAVDGNPFPVTKPELVRLKYNGGGNRIAFIDLRSDTGSLEYADGVAKRVYEEWAAQYGSTGLESTSFIRLKTVISLTTDVTNINTDINSIKEDYLPRDGSKPMTGDLNLGANQISKLDTNESFSAIVRSADFNLGYSGRRGQIYPDRPIGRALVDGGDTLNLNYAKDWEKTKIFGDVNLANLQQSQGGSDVPLVVDQVGNLSRGVLDTSGFEKGMIMMWSGTTPPAGWELCNSSRVINGVTVPDLRGRFVVGYNPSDGDYNSIGDVGGAKNVTLTVNQMPRHRHGSSSRFNKFSSIASDYRNDSTPGSIDAGAPTDELAVARLASSAIRNEMTEKQIGGNAAHENRPPYYTLAFIIYVGSAGNNITPTTRIQFSDGTTAIKTSSVVQGGNISANLRSVATDSDGTIAQFVWEQCFENDTVSEDWRVVNTVPGPTNIFSSGLGDRVGKHFFRNRVIDNSGATSEYSNVLQYTLTRQVIVPTSSVSIFQSFVSFTDSGLAGIQFIDITSQGGGWRVKQNLGNVNVSPPSSSNSGTTQVALTVGPTNQPRIGEVVFETADGRDTAGLPWEQIGNGPQQIAARIDSSSCFDLESKVVMANGRSKKLANIKVGDKLRGYNFPNRIDANSDTYTEWSGMLKEAKVVEVEVKDMLVKTVESYVRLTMVDGTILNVTKDHPLLVSKDEKEVSWIKPSDLRSGLFLIDKDGKPQEIDSKKTINKSLEIGVLDVENIDNYMIQGFIVHNAEIQRDAITAAPIDVIK
ncbi:hypothetical protein D1816_04765 [Aquimarina sp. AD10]|uniref:hypothetical protein n=1 Tax=Aquimarina sp. AD10 TaxID=1714849 RepID=UPI000E539349|nr:hypothetical protein [Aquimarina sp. AD10]AXT59696.1 hypothetical protein D1816_04765 [Aquimarina sp. AD10]RKM97572.1 hypothetical protein D7033_14345 [Aquimarina sp. AD10]